MRGSVVKILDDDDNDVSRRVNGSQRQRAQRGRGQGVRQGELGQLQGPGQVVFLDEPPRNPAGKVIKRELEEGNDDQEGSEEQGSKQEGSERETAR